MNRFVKSILDLNELEQFARRKNKINQLHPSLKIMVTLIYIIMITSVSKYNLNGIILFGLYPILIISLTDIPFKSLSSKLVIPIIFSISLGLFNPLLDREIIMNFGRFNISGGMISLVVLIFKAMFSITATILLVSTTSISELGRGLVALKVPSKLVVLLLLMYRYIGVLLNEVSKTIDAYHLRTGSNSGLHISVWGSLVGQIMIRSYRRSEEVYNAMLIRGYSIGEYNDK